MLIVAFADNEEQLFQKTIEWLSSRLSSSPVYIKQIVNGFQLDPLPVPLITKMEILYI